MRLTKSIDYIPRLFLKAQFSIAVIFLAAFIFTAIQSFQTNKVNAQAASTINFQGKIVNLSDGTNLVNGSPSCVVGGADTCDIRASIYDASSGGTLLWQETHSNVELGDANGIFNLSLNSVCNDWVGGCAGSGVDWTNGGAKYLQLEFDTDGNGDFSSAETFTRKLLQSVPYSYYADRAGSVNGLTSGDFIQFRPGAAQNSGNTTNPLMWVNEDGTGTANLIELEVGGNDVFIVDNNGRVGIGGQPVTIFDIAGSATDIEAMALYSTLTGSSVGLSAIWNNVSFIPNTASPNSFTGIYNNTQLLDGSSDISQYIGFDSELIVDNASDDNVASLINIYIRNADLQGTGTLTDNYGLYIENQTAGVNDYGIYIAGADTYSLWVDLGITRIDGGIQFEADVNDLLSQASSGSGATTDLYYGNDLLCDVSETNCGWLTASSNLFTDGGTVTYLTSTTDDFAIGATNTLVAPFSVDESANTVRIGEGSGSNAVLSMYASDGDTGSITYTTSDQWNFAGGDILTDGTIYSTRSINVNGRGVSSTITNTSTGVLNDQMLYYGSLNNSTTGTLNQAIGVNIFINNGSSGTIVDLVGGRYIIAGTGVGGTINTAKGIEVNVSGSFNSTVDNFYGLYINDINVGTNDYGIYIQGADTYALWVDNDISRFDGNVLIGGITSGSSAYLNIAAATTSSAQINLASSSSTNPSAPTSGDLWWNGTQLYFFNGTSNIDLLESGTPTVSLTNRSGGTLNAGAIVIQDTANDNSFTTSTTANDPKVVGILIESCANLATCKVQVSGATTVTANATVNRGDYIYTSTSAGQAKSSTEVQVGVIAVALTSDNSAPYTPTVMIFKDAKSGNAQVFSNSGSVSDGSYLEIAHNQSSNDILATGWYQEGVTSNYIAINEPTGENHNLNDSALKGYWVMDEASGDLDDKSSNNNTLIDKNAPAYQQSGKGEDKYSISLNSDANTGGAQNDHDYLCTGTGTTCADDADFDFTGDFTIGGWMKLSSSQYFGGYFISKWNQGVSGNYSISVAQTTGALTFTVFTTSNGSYLTTSYGTSFYDDKWHHIVGMVKGTNIFLYIDGELANANGTTAGTRQTDSAASFVVGWDHAASFGNGLTGSYDEIFAYSRALEPAEVQSLYDYGARKFKIEQTDSNTVRLYNYSGQSQTLRLDAVVNVAGGVGGGGSLFTDGGATTYLTATSDDFAIGGNSLASPLSVDVSANTVRIGTGSSANAVLSMYASDGDTGTLTYTTNDRWEFSGGDVSVLGNLITTTISSSGDWTWSATSPTVTTNSGETIVFTDGSDSFTINMSGSSFSFSDGTNSFTFDVDTGPVYAGTARPLRRNYLSPEYSGATLTADGSNNTGVMTSDFCENGASASIPDRNTSVCNTSGDIHNYYSWTTTQGSAQDYEIWVRWRVPDNFSAWASSDPIRVWGKRTDATNNAVTVYLYDTAGTLENTGGTQVAGTTWTQTSLESSFGGTYTPGSYMTFQIVMNADSNDSVQVGEISIDYLTNN